MRKHIKDLICLNLLICHLIMAVYLSSSFEISSHRSPITPTFPSPISCLLYYSDVILLKSKYFLFPFPFSPKRLSLACSSSHKPSI